MCLRFLVRRFVLPRPFLLVGQGGIPHHAAVELGRSVEGGGGNKLLLHGQEELGGAFL